MVRKISSNKTRHVNLKFHFVKDLIDDNVIKLKFIRTDEMIADFLTKAVSCNKLLWTIKNINLLDKMCISRNCKIVHYSQGESVGMRECAAQFSPPGVNCSLYYE